MNLHHPNNGDDLTALTRAALGDLLDLAPHPDSQPVAVWEERRSRVVLVPVAAGLIAVAGVGAVAAIDHGGSGTSSGGPSSPVSSPASTSGEMDATGMEWFLPVAVPDGYSLVDISGRDMRLLSPTGPLRAPDSMVVVSTEPPALVVDQTEQMWIRRGPDGLTNVDTISVSASGPVNNDWGEPTDTINGGPAMVLGQPSRESPGWTITLPVGDILVTLQATDGVTRDEALAAAGGVTVEDGRAVLDPAAVPVGFELVAPADTQPFDVWTSWTEQLDFAADVPLVGSGPIQVTVSSGVRESLDALSVGEDERREIDGREYSIAMSDNGYTAVTWLVEGTTFTASGAAALDDVLTIATSLEPVTDDAAAAVAKAVTESALLLPEKGRTTFADGVEVTVRGSALDPEGPPVALCVEAPIVQCVRPSLGSDSGVAIYTWFDVGGSRRLIAWNGFEPTLGPDQPTVEVAAATTGIGWFLDAPMPDGNETASVGVVASDGSLIGIAVTADLVRP